MIHRTAIIGGERIEVTWSVAENALEATVNGRTYKLEFRQVGDGAYWFGWNGLSIQALVTPQDQGYMVSIGGNRIPVEFLESAKKSRDNFNLPHCTGLPTAASATALAEWRRTSVKTVRQSSSRP